MSETTLMLPGVQLLVIMYRVLKCLDEVNSSDESLLEFRIKNTNKTSLRKGSKTGRAASSPQSSNKKKVLKKAGLSKKPVKFAPQSKDNFIITQRLNNLEEALCKVESNYANEAAKVLSTEQTKESVVSSKFIELVRDLKDQHKHQLNLINGEMKSMREEYELQIKTLIFLNESLKGSHASVNDRCNNLEKRVKDLKVDNCELSDKLKNSELKVKSNEAEIEITGLLYFAQDAHFAHWTQYIRKILSQCAIYVQYCARLYFFPDAQYMCKICARLNFFPQSAIYVQDLRKIVVISPMAIYVQDLRKIVHISSMRNICAIYAQDLRKIVLLSPMRNICATIYAQDYTSFPDAQYMRKICASCTFFPNEQYICKICARL